MKALAWLLPVAFLAWGLPAVAECSPHEVIRSTAGDVARLLDGRRDYLRRHPDELYALISEVLLPHFDLRYSSYLVLGKQHWRAASKEQRDRFVQAFYQFLVRNYATGLLDFNPGTLAVLDDESSPDRKRHVVHTEMRMDGGRIVPIDYRLRRTGDGWRVYDVRIQGVSYVQNYRSQFAAEIDALGLDAVIARLESEIRAQTQPQSTGG
ncbi:MAG TPA: ABC transporter substrate-binding protein [Chromatiales bacterium]|nr:ABC transporter substrate-binding protein [Chromatiales bacterium]